MSSKIKVDTIENVAGSGNVSLGSGHNLVVPGNLNVDTNLLDVDASNDTVGIGTTVNTRKLNINAGSYGHMLLDTADAAHGIQILGQANSAANSGFDIQYAASTGMKIRTLAVQPLSLQTSASAGSPAEALKIDTAGRVFKPRQVSFIATGSNGAYVNTSPVPFPNVVQNIGSHYNNSNYTFTAPVAGTYLFHLHMGLTQGHNNNQLYPWFNVNGSNTTYVYQSINASTAHSNANMTQIFPLSANDTVKVTFVVSGSSGQYYNNSPECRFMGYLLG
jgi:hypothetical protein